MSSLSGLCGYRNAVDVIYEVILIDIRHRLGYRSIVQAGDAMKIVRYCSKDGSVSFGALHPDGSVTVCDGGLFHSLSDTGTIVSGMKLLAPLVPSAILCVGLNYYDHAREMGLKKPDFPVLFMKNPSSLANPCDPVIIPRSCESAPEVDYEIELAVVIGRAAKNVSEAEAMDCVFGYTIANDVSARICQKQNGGQWVRAKSFDTFCPLGPALVTKDEIPDPQSLTLVTRLNDRTVQDGSTSDMIFSVARIISLLSQDMTILPGSVILTGTPAGVGVGRNPQLFLSPGDHLDLTIAPIGTLSNPVIAASEADTRT